MTHHIPTYSTGNSPQTPITVCIQCIQTPWEIPSEIAVRLGTLQSLLKQNWQPLESKLAA